MIAAAWYGKKDVRIISTNAPMITEQTDAIIKVTTTTICVSDLHLYHNSFSGLKEETILGHETVGIVEEIGEDVSDFKKGDRVVVAFSICCGQCNNCKEEKYSLCNITNPSKEMEKMYGDKLCGIFGYGSLAGGYDGGQAEYLRVPFADNQLLKIPDELKDDQVLFLSDIACTGYHATELANVKKDCTVGIFGAGPVGLMSVIFSKFKEAKRIIVIDQHPHLLKLAEKLGATETINFKEEDVIERVHELLPGGFDCCIDAVGFRYTQSFLHKLEKNSSIRN